jgi:two-component system cell cycle sensor histidine kinase/response regulator CckA
MTETLRLFLIEDRDEHALLIQRSLERSGHQVERCRTGADALIVLAHKPFDLVILDQNLEDMTGVDLLQRLSGEGVLIPVLMVTGYGDEKLAARVLRAGALDYIVKDVGLNFLLDLPKRVVESVTRHRLEHLNGLLIQALESARDGILITDLNGTILTVNQALVELTGYGRSDLVGQNPRLLKSPTQAPEVFADMWRTILARKSWMGEISNRRQDGSLFPTSITISPIVDAQHRLTHFVGILRDITAQKALERQLLQAQKMQSVGTLAGGVAHEFNNLLAGINGYASLGLREADLNPTLREFLTQIVTLSERAAGLTKQLLAFARKPALTRQRTQVADLLRSTAELVTRTLHQEVTLDIEPGPEPALVEADANQLQHSLINLALNARDALRERSEGQVAENGPELVFRLRRVVLTAERVGFPQKVPPGDYLVVEVEDRGSGMSAEVLSQAVDPFFTTKEVGKGTGLGLPMVFGIVQGHQGFLTIDTAVGQGTCVRLYLPRLIEVPGVRVRVGWSGSQDLEPEASPGRSILVIDDEPAVLDVVRRFLQIAGHRVTTVTSGQEGTDLLAVGHPIDLVILDVRMPREDTRSTFEKIRQLRPGVPVLLCTGLSQADPAPELLRCPNVEIIRKPFRMNELWYAVRQALGDD